MTVYHIRCRIEVTIPVDGELADGSLARGQIAAMDALHLAEAEFPKLLPKGARIEASPAQLVRARKNGNGHAEPVNGASAPETEAAKVATVAVPAVAVVEDRMPEQPAFLDASKRKVAAAEKA